MSVFYSQAITCKESKMLKDNVFQSTFTELPGMDVTCDKPLHPGKRYSLIIQELPDEAATDVPPVPPLAPT